MTLQVLALIHCGRLQPLAMGREAGEGNAGLRRDLGAGPMSAELALMWRVVCTWLQVAASCLSWIIHKH
jgi:hypothetical protein